MAVYLIADIKVTDDSWIPDYATHVHPLVEKHGGKYFSRSGNVSTIEGEGLDTSIVAILKLPSMEAIQAFGDDSAYKKYKLARQAGSISRFHVNDDTDLAGTIPYLPKG